MDSTITNAIPEHVLEATGQDFVGKYSWLFVVGLVALMFKSRSRNLPQRYLCSLGTITKKMMLFM